MASRQGYERLVEQIQKEENLEAVGDCLQILWKLLNFEMVDYNRADLNLVDLCEKVSCKNFPVHIKEKLLLIVDFCIYKDEGDLLEYLVTETKILLKIWGVPDELKYIVINIMSNIALVPNLKSYLQEFLGSFRIMLSYQMNARELCHLLLNYLSTQKYQVETNMQQALIDEASSLLNLPPDVKETVAKIWLGLVTNEYEKPIPQWIMEEEDDDYCQDIQHIIKEAGQNTEI